ncbi:PREDICTED: uncharacterized protein LOC109168694 [Ipomoea nil]|uniref:uncharacterized protein LOC109168694 n=1 Tax=Ipomoea nil TaxID=35883 RepID=UPI0009012FF8|nr:PREDICTED: uncharacterized protein LOC109168694 [Ipomoea nil]
MATNERAEDDELPVLERTDEVVKRLTQRWADIALEEEVDVGFKPVGEDVGVLAEEEERRWVCVGRFLTSKVVKLEYMRQVMASIWQPVWGMQATEIQSRLFMFIFYDETDMQRVLDEGPWSFDNNTLVCRQVEADVRPAAVELKSVDMWVQLYDLPLGYTSGAVLEQAANFNGSFVKVDDRYPRAPWKTFHRVRVSIPVDKPLNLLGHAYKFCKLARKSGLTADKFPYTADLKAGGGRRGTRQVGEPWLIALEGKGKGVARWEEKGRSAGVGGVGDVRLGEVRAGEGVVVAASKRRRGDGVDGGGLRMDAGDVIMAELSKNGFTAGLGGQARPSQ